MDKTQIHKISYNCYIIVNIEEPVGTRMRRIMDINDIGLTASTLVYFNGQKTFRWPLYTLQNMSAVKSIRFDILTRSYDIECEHYQFLDPGLQPEIYMTQITSNAPQNMSTMQQYYEIVIQKMVIVWIKNEAAVTSFITHKILNKIGDTQIISNMFNDPTNDSVKILFYINNTYMRAITNFINDARSTPTENQTQPDDLVRGIINTIDPIYLTDIVFDSFVYASDSRIVDKAVIHSKLFVDFVTKYAGCELRNLYKKVSSCPEIDNKIKRVIRTFIE